MDDAAKRAELEGWIAGSERMQRRLRRALPLGIAVAIAACFWIHPLGVGLLATVIMFGGVGAWITASHIAEWRGRIARIGEAPRPITRRARD